MNSIRTPSVTSTASSSTVCPIHRSFVSRDEWDSSLSSPATHLCYAAVTMLHLDLHPELETQSATQAAQRGLTLDRYAEDVLASVLLD